jgi:hypothetical protein
MKCEIADEGMVIVSVVVLCCAIISEIGMCGLQKLQLDKCSNFTASFSGVT